MVDQANGLEEEEIVSGLEYLVLGHFKRNERDRKGVDKMAWLSMGDLMESALSEEAIDEALDAWETESAAMRAKAKERALARRT